MNESGKIRVTIWNERSKDEQSAQIRKAYPDGMSEAVAEIFQGSDFSVRIAHLGEPEDGLSEQVLAETDVLLYWAHSLHNKLSDDTAVRIEARAKEGMGVLFMHSAHVSKPFQRIMGTTGFLNWREDGQHERIYTVNPKHPIAAGLPESFVLEHEEMYGEYFDIPTPDDIIFLGWYPGGELFRSGFTYHCGEGRVFYFQPGHETFPNYYDANIRKVLYNAVLWLAKRSTESNPGFNKDDCKHVLPKVKHIWMTYKK